MRGTPTAGVLLHWVIISRRWERNQKRDSEWPINTDSPRKKKVLRTRGQAAKSQAPKTPRNYTILPEHLLAHTLITYVYSHYCIRSFCHHFPCKNDVLITSTRIEFSNHENIAVAYTNFLSIASCRIVNVRYRNDLLVLLLLLGLCRQGRSHLRPHYANIYITLEPRVDECSFEVQSTVPGWSPALFE